MADKEFSHVILPKLRSKDTRPCLGMQQGRLAPAGDKPEAVMVNGQPKGSRNIKSLAIPVLFDPKKSQIQCAPLQWRMFLFDQHNLQESDGCWCFANAKNHHKPDFPWDFLAVLRIFCLIATFFHTLMKNTRQIRLSML
ncbi:MAG: hypothetical protein HKP20_10135 [Akkermansiaceae bacterium]|nr:hypothetical protein [Akkermansiaceae bacterium]